MLIASQTLVDNMRYSLDILHSQATVYYVFKYPFITISATPDRTSDFLTYSEVLGGI
jgi:hypothetical protein